MPPLSVLLKPASSACNLNCAYCFYKDEAKNRDRAFEGMLTAEKAEECVKSAMEYAEKTCSFMFQGGEPTLAGLEFFENFIKLEKKYEKKGVRCYNAIQTNGMLIDDDWARFFKKNNFLVGLSLDGSADIHNANRSSSFNKVINAARVLEKHRVKFNILCVVTSKTARSAEKVYNFFKKQKFGYLQFIPCLEPIGTDRTLSDFSPSAQEYAAFLNRIFDLWYADLLNGNYISIRHIDNILSIMLNGRAENCAMCGHCSIQFVVEGDGGVYPCDFFVLDSYRLGTLGEQSFEDMVRSETAVEFIKSSFAVPEKCRECAYYSLCRNGCRRDRAGENGENYYCSAYYDFFSKKTPQLQQAARIVNSIVNG